MSPAWSGTLVLGIGNRLRSDDGVGPRVADRLAAAGVAAAEHSGEGAGLMAAWEGAERVVLVDATRSGAAPGTLVRLDATAQALPRDLLRCSSHLFGVAEAVETARALNRLPPVLIVYGIEGGRFDFGESLTPAVAAAAGEAARRIAGELGVVLTPEPGPA
ncbi:hydrogenase maturation protease [Azospirillum halopraeferens]|uniref:hydrogenase maturation protease n=1 Tax=Azospirillum halopraeferens TaxID=34010 RepID=UPI0004006E6A|nr:hydrogenase maturation protease [Azospirillum halopraeferens]